MGLREVIATIENSIERAAKSQYYHKFTVPHQKRSALYAEILALELGLDPKIVEEVLFGMRVHDLGKSGWRDHMYVASDYGEREWAIAKNHPQESLNIIEGVMGKVPQNISDVVSFHHVRYDRFEGQPYGGYPSFNGVPLPITSMIAKLADAMDAQTTRRPFQRGGKPPKRFSEMMDDAAAREGTEYGNIVVQLLLNLQENYKTIIRTSIQSASTNAYLGDISASL